MLNSGRVLKVPEFYLPEPCLRISIVPNVERETAGAGLLTSLYVNWKKMVTFG